MGGGNCINKGDFVCTDTPLAFLYIKGGRRMEDEGTIVTYRYIHCTRENPYVWIDPYTYIYTTCGAARGAAERSSRDRSLNENMHVLRRAVRERAERAGGGVQGGSPPGALFRRPYGSRKILGNVFSMPISLVNHHFSCSPAVGSANRN